MSNVHILANLQTRDASSFITMSTSSPTSPWNSSTEGVPPAVREASWVPIKGKDPGLKKLTKGITPGLLLKRVLSHLDVCSKEWIIRQYDHEVQGGASVKPLTGIENDGPSDAAVLRPVLNSNRGCVIGSGINVRYGAIDPYKMATAVIDEALRNIVAVGGNPHRTAILDNFSWGSSTDPSNSANWFWQAADATRPRKRSACRSSAARTA